MKSRWIHLDGTPLVIDTSLSNSGRWWWPGDGGNSWRMGQCLVRYTLSHCPLIPFIVTLQWSEHNLYAEAELREWGNLWVHVLFSTFRSMFSFVFSGDRVWFLHVIHRPICCFCYSDLLHNFFAIPICFERMPPNFMWHEVFFSSWSNIRNFQRKEKKTRLCI